MEVDALKSEIDRISTATEYNGMQLLDGSLGGSSSTTAYGAKYGSQETIDDLNTDVMVTSNIAGTKVALTVAASGKGGENAVWSADGKTITVNLAEGRTYSDDEIQDLIDNAALNKDAGQEQAPAEVKWSTAAGQIKAAAATTGGTVAGVRATIANVDLSSIVGDGTNGLHGSSDQITVTANSYGDTKYVESAPAKITINADRDAGKEGITVETAFSYGTAGSEITLHLATGVEYTNRDIEQLLKNEGYDVTVELTDSKNTDGDNDGKVYFNKAKTGVDIELAGGKGVGKDGVGASGQGLTFQ
ncbi:MAG: flagellar hook protein, partial [[Eubacterium] siraeum]|nr:flagellar hook protein [[Eubacterium] siraeum]